MRGGKGGKKNGENRKEKKNGKWTLLNLFSAAFLTPFIRVRSGIRLSEPTFLKSRACISLAGIQSWISWCSARIRHETHDPETFFSNSFGSSVGLAVEVVGIPIDGNRLRGRLHLNWSEPNHAVKKLIESVYHLVGEFTWQFHLLDLLNFYFRFECWVAFTFHYVRLWLFWSQFLLLDKNVHVQYTISWPIWHLSCDCSIDKYPRPFTKFGVFRGHVTGDY